MLSRSVCDSITAVAGTALIGSGLYGLISPAGMARRFGVVNVTKDMTVFYPGIGGRNLGAGLFVWWAKYNNQPKALGAFLLCIICNGLADTYLLLKHDGEVDTVWLHVFNIGVAAATGISLLRGADS